MAKKARQFSWMQEPIQEPQDGVIGIVSVHKNLFRTPLEEGFKAFLGASNL